MKYVSVCLNVLCFRVSVFWTDSLSLCFCSYFGLHHLPGMSNYLAVSLPICFYLLSKRTLALHVISVDRGPVIYKFLML